MLAAEVIILPIGSEVLGIIPEFFQLGAIGHVHGGLIPILGSDGSDGESEDQKVVDFMGVLKTQNWNHCLGT